MKDTTSPFPAQQPPGKEHPLFPRLFSPIKIGPITAKSRAVNSAHGTPNPAPCATARLLRQRQVPGVFSP